MKKNMKNWNIIEKVFFFHFVSLFSVPIRNREEEKKKTAFFPIFYEGNKPRFKVSIISVVIRNTEKKRKKNAHDKQILTLIYII